MGVITLQQAAQWCGGRFDPKHKDVTFFGAGSDAKTIGSSQLYVALEGVGDDSAQIAEAFSRGAAAVLCNRCEVDCPAIEVSDIRIALGMIARGERERIGMKVVGITGSVGKSTTKEMVASVLQTTYRVNKTPINHNDDITMPMALLAMEEDTEVAVVEMGVNPFREVAYLASIAKPDVGVITNIGTMHIERLGSMDGILKAKLEIVEDMGRDGKIFLNGDDALLWNQRLVDGKEIDFFGIRNGDCHILGKDITECPGMLRFWACCQDKAFPIELALEGRHYVHDALAAIAVGLHFGVSPENIRKSLAEFQNAAGRQEIYQAKGYTIIRDCYNAGPESMAAALEVMGKQPGRHVAVLGDMLELGVCTQAEHYKVGRIAAEKADILLTFGENSVRMLNGALTGGMSQTNARSFTDRDRLVEVLKQRAKPGDVILFKGSRGMRMEMILQKFLEET